jgi:hypothetical protein
MVAIIFCIWDKRAGSFASGNGGFTLEDGGIGNISGKGAEVKLGFAKMGEHDGPGAVSNSFAVPEAKVLLEDRFLGQYDIGQIDHLLRSVGWPWTFVSNLC